MAETFTITDAQIDSLTEAIRHNAESIKMQTGLTDDGNTFCNIWPTAKGGLDMLAQILGFVPGVGVFAGLAIKVVIAAGDAAKRALCNN